MMNKMVGLLGGEEDKAKVSRFSFVTEQSFVSPINQGGVVQGGGVPWHAVGGGRSGRGLFRPLCNSLHRRTAPVEHR